MAVSEHELYRRIKLLGEGSFGKAYLVECVSDNTKCVIKQMDLNSMSEDEKKETYKEARILEALKHPNIIRFREVYRTRKGKLCIVMDFADGGDLAKKVKEANKTYLPESQILDWFTQICLAIKHVHDRKIIHRDLKCQNIFLTKENTIRLGDFGIARVLSSTKEKAKTMVGTPYYLSPEIIENKPYSFKSDIWSLGVVLYELCALKPPFNADSIHYLALKIVRGSYSPIPSHYSKELKNLVGMLLSIDPNNRPSVHEVLKMGFITKRIRGFLSESKRFTEFSHTILHNKNCVDFRGKIPEIDTEMPQQKHMALGLGQPKKDDDKSSNTPANNLISNNQIIKENNLPGNRNAIGFPAVNNFKNNNIYQSPRFQNAPGNNNPVGPGMGQGQQVIGNNAANINKPGELARKPSGGAGGGIISSVAQSGVNSNQAQANGPINNIISSVPIDKKPSANILQNQKFLPPSPQNEQISNKPRTPVTNVQKEVGNVNYGNNNRLLFGAPEEKKNVPVFSGYTRDEMKKPVPERRDENVRNIVGGFARDLSNERMGGAGGVKNAEPSWVQPREKNLINNNKPAGANVFNSVNSNRDQPPKSEAFVAQIKKNEVNKAYPTEVAGGRNEVNPYAKREVLNMDEPVFGLQRKKENNPSDDISKKMEAKRELNEKNAELYKKIVESSKKKEEEAEQAKRLKLQQEEEARKEKMRQLLLQKEKNEGLIKKEKQRQEEEEKEKKRKLSEERQNEKKDKEDVRKKIREDKEKKKLENKNPSRDGFKVEIVGPHLKREKSGNDSRNSEHSRDEASEKKEDRLSLPGPVEKEGTEKSKREQPLKKERNIPVEIYVPRQNPKSMSESTSVEDRNISHASSEMRSEKKISEESNLDDKRETEDKRIIEEKIWEASKYSDEEDEISRMLIELHGIAEDGDENKQPDNGNLLGELKESSAEEEYEQENQCSDNKEEKPVEMTESPKKMMKKQKTKSKIPEDYLEADLPTLKSSITRLDFMKNILEENLGVDEFQRSYNLIREKFAKQDVMMLLDENTGEIKKCTDVLNLSMSNKENFEKNFSLLFSYVLIQKELEML